MTARSLLPLPSLRSARSRLALAALLAMLAALPLAAAPSQTVQRVSVIVNDSVISSWDVEQRTKLAIVSSGAPNTPEIRERIQAQVIRSLIDERLQLQEAQRNKISVTREEIKESLEKLARQNSMSLERISQTLDQNGISLSTLEQQIEAELSWNKLVSQRLAPRVQLSEEEVNEAFRRAEESAQKMQFLVSEIFLSIDDPSEADEVLANAENILVQLRAGAGFPNVARQFSQASTAAAGGEIGWITEGQLPPAVDTVLQTMRPQQISKPIRTAAGYYIIAVRDMRVPEGMAVEPVVESTLPPGRVRLAQVLVPPQGGGQEGARKTARLAGEIQAAITGCSNAPAVVSKVRGASYNDLGVFNRKDLQPELQQVLANVQTGRSTPVFGTPQGFAFLIVCDGGVQPKIETFEMPTRDDVERRLFNQQLSVLARRYLRDLRRDAVVEMR